MFKCGVVVASFPGSPSFVSTRNMTFDPVEISTGQRSYCTHLQWKESLGTRLELWGDVVLISINMTCTHFQAVRSVAFSESGQMVAVGANSKCLRLFSAEPILDTGRLEWLVKC